MILALSNGEKGPPPAESSEYSASLMLSGPPSPRFFLSFSFGYSPRDAVRSGKTIR